MTERPILFSAPMVRAILAGTKGQTRRVVKPQPDQRCTRAFLGLDGVWRFSYPTARCPVSESTWDVRCPYGAPGERLWVRETWAKNADQLSETRMNTSLMYRADGERRAVDNGTEKPWRPSIHMSRWASRITLEVTDVRVERLQDISEADAKAEGVAPADEPNELRWQHYVPYAIAYRKLWDSINGPGSWEANPFVWCVSFKRVTQGAPA